MKWTTYIDFGSSAFGMLMRFLCWGHGVCNRSSVVIGRETAGIIYWPKCRDLLVRPNFKLYWNDHEAQHMYAFLRNPNLICIFLCCVCVCLGPRPTLMSINNDAVLSQFICIRGINGTANSCCGWSKRATALIAHSPLRWEPLNEIGLFTISRIINIDKLFCQEQFAWLPHTPYVTRR